MDGAFFISIRQGLRSDSYLHGISRNRTRAEKPCWDARIYDGFKAYWISDKCDKPESTPIVSPFGRAVIFHMERCVLTLDQVSDRIGLIPLLLFYMRTSFHTCIPETAVRFRICGRNDTNHRIATSETEQPFRITERLSCINLILRR